MGALSFLSAAWEYLGIKGAIIIALLIVLAVMKFQLLYKDIEIKNLESQVEANQVVFNYLGQKYTKSKNALKEADKKNTVIRTIVQEKTIFIDSLPIPQTCESAVDELRMINNKAIEEWFK